MTSTEQTALAVTDTQEMAPVAVPEPRHLHAVTTTDAAAVSGAEQASTWADRAAWARAAFTPDSGLWTDRQPSIGEIVRRASAGAQVPESGPVRVASTVYGYGAAANKAVVRTWEWIVDHPARLAVAVLLLALSVMFPETRHLLAVLLDPVVWAQHLLEL